MVRLSTLWMVLPGILLALAACVPQTSSESGAGVRPITDILDSDPAFTEIGPRSATLRVVTDVPVVCAVVYGLTSDYGQIATDADMGGGAHTDHHALLTGLVLDSVYYARLQGVGPDGTLYRSEEYTFRAAPAAESGGGPNVALAENGGRVAGVSSNFGGGPDDGPWGALSATDGDGGTAWSSDGDGDDAWIEIGLAAETRVTRVGFWTRSMGSSAEIHAFQIITDRGETFGPFHVGDASQPYYFETDFVARRLRFEALMTSGGNTGAVEIEVYGEPAP
jgi:hypothetical protein